MALGALGFLAAFGLEIFLVLAAPLAAFLGAAFLGALAVLAGLAGEEAAGAGVVATGAVVVATGAGVVAALGAFGFLTLGALVFGWLFEADLFEADLFCLVIFIIINYPS